MRNLRTIFSCLLLAAIVVSATGCFWRNSDDESPTPVTFHPVEGLMGVGGRASGDESPPVPVARIDHPLPPPDRPDDQLLYRLRVYYVVERVVDDKPPEGLWRFVDEAVLNDSQRHLLGVNGMRVGVGGELSLERINDALRHRSGAEVSLAPEAYGKAGLFLDVPLGRLEEDTMIMHSDRSGGMSGREFSQGSAVLRFQCTPAEGDPRRLNEVRLGPYIVHGEQRAMSRVAVAGSDGGGGRPTFPFRDLETMVRLEYGQFVMVGLEHGRRLTIGQHLFEGGQMPDRRITTVLLVPELSWLGNVPTDRLIYSERTVTPGRDE